MKIDDGMGIQQLPQHDAVNCGVPRPHHNHTVMKIMHAHVGLCYFCLVLQIDATDAFLSESVNICSDPSYKWVGCLGSNP
jgi:hypothetical protein